MQESFLENLRNLTAHEVKFIVVGGVGAVIQGCMVATMVIEIVHDRRPENVERLHRALSNVDAAYRIQPDRRLGPTEEALAGPGHHLLLTTHRPLDVLGEIGAGHGYTELIEVSETAIIDESLTVDVLSLEWLIRTKEEAGAPKDLAVLDILRETLRLKTAS
jgi:hypothetical protein